MANMLVKMTISTVLYLIITAVVWNIWSRSERRIWHKVAVGIVFGTCSIMSTHMGIDFKNMILNVRDIGPLAAGLFFDPVSGIISGVLGGAERYIAGTYFDVGSFTTLSCSLSTMLAGFLAAALNVFLYKGRRAPAYHSAVIGMVMEVFHMYVVLLTHRNDMNAAYFIVKNCSIPMIVFTGLGMMGCSILVMALSGEKYEYIPISDRERTPIAKRFYRKLLAAILIVFAVNHFMDLNLQRRSIYQEAENNLNNMATSFWMLYSNTEGDWDEARVPISYITMTGNDAVYYIVYDDKGNVLSSFYSEENGEEMLDEQEFRFLSEQPDHSVFRMFVRYYGGMNAICVKRALNMDKTVFVLLAWQYDMLMAEQTNQLYEMLLSDILLFTVLYLMAVVLVDTVVCRNLKSVNNSLQKIIGGDLNEVISVRDSAEFSLLSDDINQTVSTLKGYIDESEKRMEKELALAAFIQESALPHVFTFDRNDFEIYALMKPARQVGGDFYDYFFTDANKVALVIADVSGKGIPAAMFMMRAKTAIGNSALVGKSPAEILYEVNNILCKGNDAEMFVTAWIGIMDLETGIMTCANAGHEYPVLCRAGSDYELIKDKHGLVLAAMKDTIQTEYTIELQPGDRLFVYTDGVPEAINKDEKAYGTQRLVGKLNTVRLASQEETLTEIYGDIVEFAGEAEQFDDITMLGFTYNPRGEMN